MKTISIISSMLLFSFACAAQKGSVDPTTNVYTFKSSLADQYMFYGYEQPDRQSKKLIMFSTFPNDISANKNYSFPLGAYHETTGLKDGHKIMYRGNKKGYAEMSYLDVDNKETVFYLKKCYVKR